MFSPETSNRVKEVLKIDSYNEIESYVNNLDEKDAKSLCANLAATLILATNISKSKTKL